MVDMQGKLTQPIRISALVSGGGTNLQAVIDAISEGRVKNAEIVKVISNRKAAFALVRAEEAGISTAIVSNVMFPDPELRTKELIRILGEAGTDLILLAGYLSILAPEFVGHFRGRIINIHPARLPKHGGAGYYGLNVHRAVLESGDKISGATVHFVDEGIDTGEIIIQSEVPVLDGDTPEDLAARVLVTEHEIFPEAVDIVVKRMLENEA